MTAHFGVKSDFDREPSGQLLLAASHSIPPMIEVLTSERILATEKGPAYTAGPTVIDGDFLVIDRAGKPIPYRLI